MLIGIPVWLEKVSDLRLMTVETQGIASVQISEVLHAMNADRDACATESSPVLTEICLINNAELCLDAFDSTQDHVKLAQPASFFQQIRIIY